MNQAAVGITVPTGVASVAAAPVRTLPIGMSPSLLGPYPGMAPPLLPHPHQQQPLLELPTQFKKSSGPAITVFVGSITDRASDMLIRQILTVSWYKKPYFRAIDSFIIPRNVELSTTGSVFKEPTVSFKLLDSVILVILNPLWGLFVFCMNLKLQTRN